MYKYIIVVAGVLGEVSGLASVCQMAPLQLLTTDGTVLQLIVSTGTRVQLLTEFRH